MGISNLLVANRGEIAIRVMRSAADLGIATTCVFSADDAASRHVKMADTAIELPGRGAAAYLDIQQIVEAAIRSGADAIHPGYGFLSENAGFARACNSAGLVFVGPDPAILDLFGDKTEARHLARRADVPVLPGSDGPASLEQAEELFSSLGEDAAVMIKACAGGGGRGMRPVFARDDLEQAFTLCQSEALAAFGNRDVYLERLVPSARHIEVQIAGDGTGACVHFGERDCSIQRRRQKLIEVAPAPNLTRTQRESILEAALKIGATAQYSNVGTVEFLVAKDEFYFIETNARLQVEHTVTEEIFGIDLVRLQLNLASGATLQELGLEQDRIQAPRGCAVQVRVNIEQMLPNGEVRPTGGTLSAFDIPSGPGIRVDSFGYTGYRTNAGFDSLLAKVVAHSSQPEFPAAAAMAYRALSEFNIEGVATNIPFLQNLLRRDEILTGQADTGFVERHLESLLAQEDHRQRYFERENSSALAGASIDSSDPLAVLAHGKTAAVQSADTAAETPGPDGTVAVAAPMLGTIVSLGVAEGEAVHAGMQVLIMEAMKMQHVVSAEVNGYVRHIAVQEGDTVFEGHALLYVEEADIDAPEVADATEADLDFIRPDLAEVQARQAATRDAARPEAVQRRRKTSQRTARENIEDLCDSGSFSEYGSLVLAARRQKHSIDELIRRTPADGLIAGLGRVNGDLFGDADARCMVMSYDYTVLAGTQGKKNHQKKDRMFALAEKWRLPVVFFTEGGGGRPGDTDVQFAANLHTPAFHLFARLSGLVPMVGITSGRCFAGNAVILGCCDVVIATENSTIGMGGPAMIEGGGLGVFRPEEVGPMSVQTRNGVVDIAVSDEAAAVAAAKRYLSYFQGPIEDWDCDDQRKLRLAIPEDRLRVYDVRTVIETLVDTDSLLELRPQFGLGMVTALARIEGRPVGIVANNPTHLAGAIDSDGSDKAARFMQLCDAYDIPLVFLCDTPGNMVGPEAEKTALVRHCCRLNVIGANVSVPTFTIVLRKAYGLGAQAMAGGGFHAPFFAISWPTGEFGGMGLEGAIKLGFRDELQAIEDPDERMARYEELVAGMYERGKALNTASLFELDNVIDPAETRHWIMSGLRAAPPVPRRDGKKRPWIDTW